MLLSLQTCNALLDTCTLMLMHSLIFKHAEFIQQHLICSYCTHGKIAMSCNGNPHDSHQYNLLEADYQGVQSCSYSEHPGS